MIDLALDTEEQVKRMTGPMGNPQQMPQAAPIQKGMGEQMTDMAKQRAMSGALDMGTTAATKGMSSMLAPTVASGVEGGAMLGAGTGGMAAIGTAMPYVGAGLLAGKALGLFNQGGQVGPLSAQYAAEGTMTEEQAMALMNNQPEPMAIPMPMARPINFPDPEELLMEMSIPQPMMRPQLQDPYGADRTFSPYDMLRPDNAPNT
jgi:hypothetical protein